MKSKETDPVPVDVSAGDLAKFLVDHVVCLKKVFNSGVGKNSVCKGFKSICWQP